VDKFIKWKKKVQGFLVYTQILAEAFRPIPVPESGFDFKITTNKWILSMMPVFLGKDGIPKSGKGSSEHDLSCVALATKLAKSMIQASSDGKQYPFIPRVRDLAMQYLVVLPVYTLFSVAVDVPDAVAVVVVIVVVQCIRLITTHIFTQACISSKYQQTHVLAIMSMNDILFANALIGFDDMEKMLISKFKYADLEVALQAHLVHLGSSDIHLIRDNDSTINNTLQEFAVTHDIYCGDGLLVPLHLAMRMLIEGPL
jgi:hypothetical protein